MSLHPEFADAILAGKKRVEFRRTRFCSEVSCVVIYATAPVQRIVGFFEVLELDSASPNTLWRRYRNVSGIDAQRFRDYFAGRPIGHAIRVHKAFSLRDPVPLEVVAPSGRPPQSFQYLAGEVVDRLRRLKPVEIRAVA